MAHIETPRFPECVSLGAMSKPRYNTSQVPKISGFKSRNIEWQQSLHSFDLAHNLITADQHQTLLDFFHSIRGMGNTFRVQDPCDHSVTYETGALLGVTTPDNQLRGESRVPELGSPTEHQPVISAGPGYGNLIAAKRYTAGARIYGISGQPDHADTYRPLQKLVAPVTVYRDSVQVALGAGAGEISSIDLNNGRIVMVPDQTRSITSHTVVLGNHRIFPSSGFSPDFITQDFLNPIGGLVYIDGVTGTAATLLNGRSHRVLVSFAGYLEIDTDTSGFSASGGNAYYYPQPHETFTITCDFDVPCRFASDEASFEIPNRNRQELFYRWAGINLEEERIPL